MKDPTIKTVTKRELLDAIAVSTGYRRSDLTLIVQAVLDQIVTELRNGHRIEFRDFGVFEVRLRRARLGRNPHTNDPVPVEPRMVVKFKAGREMRLGVHEAGEAAIRNATTKVKSTKPRTKAGKSELIEVKPAQSNSATKDALLRQPGKPVPKREVERDATSKAGDGVVRGAAEQE